MNPLPPLEPHLRARHSPGPDDVALVMGGGGARAAYQVGFLRAVAQRFPSLHVPYITGVSAGAINAAHLAAHHGTFIQAVEELSQLWSRLTIESVFRVDMRSLAANVLSWAYQLASGGGPSRVRGFVDTAPLRAFLSDALHTVDGEITGIASNLTRKRLRAVALSTSSYGTGQSVTWVQGENIEEWERPQRRSENTTLTVEHVMASSALPLFFPAVRLGTGWYGDGGIRLTAPLSPAVHLGARRVLAISTRYAPSMEEAQSSAIAGYPPPAQVVGVLMNAVFLDLLDHDALRLDRLNHLLEHVPAEQRLGLRRIKIMVLRPSRDLGRLSSQYEAQLPRTFRFLTRGLGTRETKSPDFLSLVMFQPDYLRSLMEIGEADAEDRVEEIEEFLFDGGE